MATTMQERTGQETMTQTEHADPASMSIAILKDGPYLVSGSVPLTEEIITPVGGHLEYEERRAFPVAPTYALCRCGQTTTPPFCDGAHVAAHFDGTETAGKEPFEQRADVYDGEGVYLLDDNRCAFARFCHREDGDVWTLTAQSGDPVLKEEAIKASSDCPAGRLVHYDSKSNEAYEPHLAPGIALLQDPGRSVSGPLFVRGGIRLVGSDGSDYELRNRYTLCRCGVSRNKPFCDAMHVPAGFSDNLDN